MARLVLLALVAAACSGERETDFEFVNAGVVEHETADPQVAGGTPAQRALLLELITRIDPSGIRLARVHAPPNGYRPSRKMKAVGNLWLTVHVRSAWGHNTISAMWKASLLAGAFRDAAHERSIATLLGYSRVIEYVPTAPTHESGALLRGPFAHHVRAPGADRAAAEIEKALRRIDSDVEVERVVVRFIRPIRLAATIDVYVENPDGAVGRMPRLPSDLLEGSLVRLRGPGGKVLAAWMASARASAGGSWGLRRNRGG